LTVVSTPTDHRLYWQALRYYSKSWRERHGADMVAMMLDASDHGEDPLNGNGRRSLMWSGLRQRFSSRPYLSLWIVLTLASAATYAWAAYRDVQIGLYADEHGTSGFNGPALLTTLIAAAGLVAGMTIMTVSLLHRPAVPRTPPAARGRAWPGWLLLLLGLFSVAGTPLLAAGLAIGARRYRAGGSAQFRVMAALSAFALGFQLLFLVPTLSLLLLN
jgi:hypothetical protein